MTLEIDPDLVREAPRSTAKLLRFLRRGLRWNIPSDQDLDDVLIDWSPEELNLNPRVVSRLTSIKQIPPLSASQDFGVFILSFRGGQLPEPAIKRVVDRLVKKQRRVKGTSQHPIWELGDLLFFCQNDGHEPSLHIVTFHEQNSKPVVKVLGWGIGVSDARVDLLAKDYLPTLVWPERQEDLAKWKQGLGRGFVATRQTINDSRNLARQMAETARTVRDSIRGLYEVETDSGPIRLLFKEIRENLADDIDPDRFADMFAQTMVYGLLTSRIINKEEFELDATATAFKFDNPFLDAVYREFREKSGEAIDVDELGLADLTDLLNRVDVEAILADFGDRTRRDDPVVYFYEEFISVYDPSQQVELGVYYTPIPVVQYIIRSVDETLKTEFGLPLGIADPTTWREMIEKFPSITLPPNANLDSPYVSMLDPATGTGTFLVEWIKKAEENVLQDVRSRGLSDDDAHRHWIDALEKVVLPQMAAFEITMASYAVAHLKVSMSLPTELRGRVSLPIYLTNTLERPMAEAGTFVFADDPISQERLRADEIKDRRNVTVIVGNPPYRERASGSGGIVEQEGSQTRTLPRLSSFRNPGSGRLEFKLHNLNVYFWRWSLWKGLELNSRVYRPSERGTDELVDLNGGGIVAFITTSPYLMSAGFAGMRRWIREHASSAYVVDCTPEGHQPDVPTRLFPGVQQPLGIMTVVRRPGGPLPENAGGVFVSVLHGSQSEKFSQLGQLSPTSSSTAWIQAPADAVGPFLPASSELWGNLRKLEDLLIFKSPGWKSNRSWVRSPSVSTLEARWARLRNASEAERSSLMMPTRDRTIDRVVAPLVGRSARQSLREDLELEAPVLVGWRSFDYQYLIPDARVIDFPRPSLWQGDLSNQVFIVELHSETVTAGPTLVFSHLIPDDSFFKGRGGRVFPARHNNTQNFAGNLMLEWMSAVGIDPNSDDWVAYLAGISGLPYFQQRFAVDLQTPGVRVPLSLAPELVRKSIELGKVVLNCHTRGNRGSNVLSKDLGDLDVKLPRCVVAPSIAPEDLPARLEYSVEKNLLRVGTGLFENVCPEVMDYSVSGLRIVRQWFNYRKKDPTGKKSGELDRILHDRWDPEWTDDLLQLLTHLTLLVSLEPLHRDLLEEILAGELF